MNSPSHAQSNFNYLPKTRLTIYCALLVSAVFLFDISIPLGVAGSVPYIVVILLSLWSPSRKLAIKLAVLCSILTIAGFFISPEGGELWKVILNRSLVIFAIWVTAILTVQWKVIEQRYVSLRIEIEQEKEKIYLATIHGAQHIINNLLNELQLVKLEAEKQPDFSADVLSYFDSMVEEASKLMKSLSAIDEMDEDKIRQSVLPGNHTLNNSD